MLKKEEKEKVPPKEDKEKVLPKEDQKKKKEVLEDIQRWDEDAQSSRSRANNSSR
jgi:hypothetical protein